MPERVILCNQESQPSLWELLTILHDLWENSTSLIGNELRIANAIVKIHNIDTSLQTVTHLGHRQRLVCKRREHIEALERIGTLTLTIDDQTLAHCPSCSLRQDITSDSWLEFFSEEF